MFSCNQKIAAGQLKALVVLILFSKGLLYLPFFANGLTSLEFLVSFLIVSLFLFLFCRIAGIFSGSIRGSFYDYIGERLGNVSAFLIAGLFLVFLLVNTGSLLQSFITLGQMYILKEQKLFFLLLPTVLSVVYLACGGIEVLGRAAAIWYPVVFFSMLVLLLCTGFYMKPEINSLLVMETEHLQVKNFFMQYSVFGDLICLMWILPECEKTDFFGGTVRSVGLLMGFFAVIAGTFGNYGISGQDFPAVNLMAEARIPVGFLERWDVIFCGLLLMGLLVSITSSVYIAGQIMERLPAGGKMRVRIGIFVGLGCLTALFLSGYEQNLQLYGKINGYVLVPLMTATVCLLAYKERGRRNGK